MLNEKVDLALNVQGVTEENKDKICKSVAEGLDGTVEKCNLVPSDARIYVERMLTSSPELQVRVAVKSVENAKASAQLDTFLPSLKNLPENAKVNAVSSVETVAKETSPSLPELQTASSGEQVSSFVLTTLGLVFMIAYF